MNKTLTYILPLVLLCFISSCRLEEPFVTEQETSEGATIEFVARPTVYDEFNVSTKVTSTEITDLENKIYTAFFMLFDNNGNRVVFKDLTENISSNTVPSQTITPDNGLSNATACFLANVPTAYAKSLTTVQHLKGKGGASQNAGALSLDYSSITSECVGIPLLTDTSKNISKEYSLPMAGVVKCNLSAMSGNTSPIQIPLERLFSKIIVKLSVNIPDDNTSDNNVPQFTLSNFVVNNMPTKVAMVTPEEGVDSTAWAASTNPDDYLNQDNWMSNFNLDNGADDSETVTTGQAAKSLFFYVPEHMVPRDRDNHMIDVPEEREQWKSTLIESPKKPIYVSIKGNLNIPGSSPMIADYNIYLGENEYDDFNLKRNKLYTNNIAIKGAEADNRVEFTHGDVSVLFKRATYLDSHFEVRPIRVKWTGEGEPGGTVTVKILDAYDDNAAVPSWVRLERPGDSERNNTSIYCGTLGKRKYFTTDLVQSDGTNAAILGSNIELSYDITKDTAGDYPTWVYVDEFITPNTDNSFSDEVRQARIRVTYTPPAGSDSKVLDVDYVITQRSVYPVVATGQTNYTYGIEFFEEYLYDYDRVDVEDLGEGEYASTQDGMEWGLEGINLSRNNKALFVTKAEPYVGDGSDSKAQEAVTDFLEIVSGIYDNIMTNQVQKLQYFYDYYTSDDVSTGWLTSAKSRDYEGYEINVEIIHYLLEILNDNTIKNELKDKIRLNGFYLNEKDPLSAIAYCYNKNRRDSEGNVVSVNADGSLNISNLHWYTPSIKELEDIISVAYNDFTVFQRDYYWSAQPAYVRNQLNVKYQASSIWNDKDVDRQWVQTGKYPWQGEYREVETTTARNLYLNVDGNGPYFQDDLYRARATKYNPNTSSNVSSSLDGVSYQLDYNGSNDFGSYTSEWNVTFNIWLTDQLNNASPVWNPANPIPTSTGETLTYHEGNDPRSQLNRVRCVYNPDPPIKATRTANDNGGYDYTYTE